MTKLHIILYVGAVLGITAAAYMYTSIAEAPHGLTLTEEEIPSESVASEPLPQATSTAASTSTETPLPVPAEPAPASNLLLGKTWQYMDTLDVNNLVVFTPKNPESFKMQFTDTRMSSLTDCNTIGANFDQSGNTLVFGPIMSTLMYCEGSDEAVYVAMLAQVEKYEVDDLQLRLITNIGQTMVFINSEI